MEAEVFTPQFDLTTIDFTPAPAGLGAVLVLGFGGFKVEGTAACPKLLLGFELTSFTAELFLPPGSISEHNLLEGTGWTTAVD